MPTDPASMGPFIHGLVPTGRRVLVLLPRGSDAVGVMLTTTIIGMEHNGDRLTFTVRPYENEEMHLTAVVFDVTAGKMLTNNGAPCFFVVDDTSRSHVPDMKDILLLTFTDVMIVDV